MRVQYRHLETALIKLFEVGESEIGAFKARIRHLRALGCPHIAKPGSGERIEYSRENTAELALALELERVGKPPRAAAWLADHLVRNPEFMEARRIPRYLVLLPGRLDSKVGDEDLSEKTSSYVEFPDGGIAFLVDGLDTIRSVLKNCRSFGIVNLSAFLSELKKYLPRPAGERV